MEWARSALRAIDAVEQSESTAQAYRNQREETGIFGAQSVTETPVDKTNHQYGNFVTYGEAVYSDEIRADRYLAGRAVGGVQADPRRGEGRGRDL
jgi:hypothetical protein